LDLFFFSITVYTQVAHFIVIMAVSPCDPHNQHNQLCLWAPLR